MFLPVSVVAASALLQASAGGQAIVTRQDLAEGIQQLDALLAPVLPGGDPALALDGAARREANARFDRLSVSFFKGDFDGAHGELARWVEELGGEPLAQTPLRIDFRGERVWTPRGLWQDGHPSGDLRIRAVGPWAEHKGETVRASLIAGPMGETRSASPIELRFDDRGLLVPVELNVQLGEPPQGAPVPATWEVLVVEDPNRRGAVLARAEISTRPRLSAARAEIEARLEKAEIKDEAALRVLRSRLKLLDDTPSPERSREFLLATDDLAEEVKAEAEALIAGRDPYRDRPGDIWRTVAKGRRDLPLRVYRPAGHGGPLPLVIALHGAGGDENFLFELAGDGYLKRLADKHGFVVACPVTTNIAASVKAFDSVVAGLRDDYTLTEDAPLMFGHSMGGIGLSTIMGRRPEGIGRAVCFAGFSGARKGCPPTLVLGAEFDPIAGPDSLRWIAQDSAGKGAEVTFELLENQGHTLGLTEAFDRAVAFWGLDG